MALYRTLATAFLILLSGTAASSPPSFDCSKARRPAEQAICASNELSALDVEISRLFGALIGREDRAGQERTRSAQRDFVRNRNACGRDASCIGRLMLARIHALGGRSPAAIIAPETSVTGPVTAPGNLQIVPNVGSVHGGESAEFSPDGRILATWDRTHIKLWNVEQGQLLRVMTHWAFILDVAWAPDSKSLASAHKDGSVKVWDPATGVPKVTFKVPPVGDEGPEVWIEGLSYGSDGDRVAAVALREAEIVAHIWLIGEQRQIAQFPMASTDPSGQRGAISTRFVTGDRELMVATTDQIQTYDLATSRRTQATRLPREGGQRGTTSSGETTGMVFELGKGLLPDRSAVVLGRTVGCRIASILLLDIATGQLSPIDRSPACNEPEGQPDYGEARYFFDAVQRRLLFWRKGIPGLHAWSLAERRLLPAFENLAALAPDLQALSPDLHRAMTLAQSEIRIHDASTGTILHRLNPHGEGAYQVVGSNGGRHVLLAGHPDDRERRRLSLWTADKVGPKRVQAPEGRASIYHVSRDGDLVLAASTDSMLQILSVPQMREVHRITLADNLELADAKFSPDERSILITHQKSRSPNAGASQDDEPAKVSLIDARTGRRHFTVEPHGADTIGVSGVAFSADGRLIAIGYWSGEIAILDARTGRRLRVVGGKEPMDSAVFAIVFTPDNTGVVGCTRDAGAALWRIADGNLVRTFETSQVSGHVNCSALAISADGQLLAAGLAERARSSGDIGAERSIVLWAVAGPPELRKLEGHEAGVGWVTFSADDKVIVSGSHDGTIRHWDRRTGKQLATSSLDRSRNWAMLTSDGFIASSSSRADVLGVVRGLDHTSLEELHHALFAPDLVREVLIGDPRGEVAAAAGVMNLEKVLASGPAPLVGIEDLGGKPETQSDLVTMRGRVVDQGKGIGRIEWRVNGITVAVVRPRASADIEIALTQRLALDSGENIIELIAYNAPNLLASRAARTVLRSVASRDREKPRLHVLAIGIDDYDDPGHTAPDGRTLAFGKLNLAVKDATTLADVLSRSAGELYRDVSVRLLRDGEATAEGIDRAITEMAGQIHPRDTFILFAAAHGTSQQGRFYMIPHGYRGGPDSLALTAIGQDRIQDWVANRIRAKRVVILLDTCESGALVGGHTRSRIDQSGSEAAIGRLHEATGRPVLTAAATGQFAHEGVLTTSGDRHGVFTWSLLDALKKGDANANGLIELSEIVAHVQSLVPELAAKFGGDGRAGVAVRDPVMGEQTARFGSRGEDFAIVKKVE